MLVLNKEQVAEILKKRITYQYLKEPKYVQPYVDWSKMQHNRQTRQFYLDTGRYWDHLMVFNDGFSEKPLSVQMVKSYLKEEYPDSWSIDIFFTVNDDAQFLSLIEEREMTAYGELKAEIYFDDTCKLQKQDLADLIEVSLLVQDKSWFEELTSKYNAYN